MSAALPIDRFAAALAHRLNAEPDPTRLDPGALAAWILDALAGRYATTLLAHEQYAERMSRDEAALRYLEAVLERALILVRRESHSIAHEILLSLCRRLPAPGWRDASLVRSHEAAPGVLPMGEVRTLVERIAALPRPLGKGSAAATRRAADGPLFLESGALRVELPDEISLWSAVASAPRRLLRLNDRAAFDVFCGVMIEALRSTHRPYQALCGLGRGLCPFDWLGVVSTAQARAAAALQRAAKAAAGEAVNVFNDAAAVAAAWEGAPVPGFASAEAFLRSEFGHALRGLAPMRRAAVDPAADPEAFDRLALRDRLDAEDATPRFLEREAFVARIDDLVALGVLTPAEASFATALHDGAEGDADAAATLKMIRNITRKLEACADGVTRYDP